MSDHRAGRQPPGLGLGPLRARDSGGASGALRREPLRLAARRETGGLQGLARASRRDILAARLLCRALASARAPWRERAGWAWLYPARLIRFPPTVPCLVAPPTVPCVTAPPTVPCLVAPRPVACYPMTPFSRHWYSPAVPRGPGWGSSSSAGWPCGCFARSSRRGCVATRTSTSPACPG